MPTMSKNLPTLQETQAVLWKSITAPEPVTEAPPFVEGDAALPAVDRINIYANMYFFRILDSLKEDFPSLVKILGDDGFHNLIVQYLQAHPPTHYSLRYAGQHLAGFIQSLSPRGPELQGDMLADLARFEWAMIEAFDAADAPLLIADDLQKIPAEQWADLKFKLHPSCQLLSLNWNVHEVFDAALSDASWDETVVRNEPTYLRVWRENLNVYHVAISVDEFAALQSIQSDVCFSDICEQAADAQQVMTWLSSWVSHGLLIP